jgi:quinol monooxygenase YgiN
MMTSVNFSRRPDHDWENEPALQAHVQTPHMATFNAQMPGLVAGEMDIKRYNVASVQDL